MKTITQKQATDGAIMVAGGAFGAMTSGAVTAVTPPKFSLAGKLFHIGLGVGITVYSKGTDKSARFGQGFGLGLALKPTYDLATEQLRKVVPVDSTKNTFVENVKAGALGLKNAFMPSRRFAPNLLASYQNASDTFDFAEASDKPKIKLNF